MNANHGTAGATVGGQAVAALNEVSLSSLEGSPSWLSRQPTGMHLADVSLQACLT